MWLKLNQAYDRLPEQRRFLTFFIPFGIVMITALTGIQIGTQNGVMIGFGSLFILITMLVQRMIYIHR